jgi:hypothetical protein
MFNTSVQLRSLAAVSAPIPEARPTERPPGFNGTWVDGLHISNCGVGISAENAQIAGRNVTIRGSRETGIKARNSHIDIDNLDIS